MKFKQKQITITLGSALFCLTSSIANAEETVIAFDMVDSTSFNLVSHVNDFAGAFSSPADGFEKYQRGVSSGIPFGLLDDSLISFPSDTFGIIDDNNQNEFFGVIDTINPQASTPVSASWTFSINNEEALGLAVDIGAMGDFENSDFFEVSIAIDGGASQVLISSFVDEAGSLTYALAGGATPTLNDPMAANDVVLNNQLQTVSSAISGTGSELVVTLTASINGTEAIAFQNLQILSGFEGDDAPEPIITAIHDVQGSGEQTPLAGELVMIEGVVVGDFQRNDSNDNGDLLGFFVQELNPDDDLMTSEGIFIFDGSTPDVDVSVGDLVRVTGIASEFFGQTQISADQVEIQASDTPLPDLTLINLPLSDPNELEAVEGMRIMLPQPLVISDYFNFDRFGEVTLAWPINDEDRLYTPTALELPGSAAYEARALANSLAQITLDDGRTTQNPDPAIHPNGEEFTLDNRFRGGDMLQHTIGVVDYRFGTFRVQPTESGDYFDVNPRPEAAPELSGRLRIASFNVLNYFTTLDEAGNLCGPTNTRCRGADNAEEFARQRAKIIAAIAELDADIVGLIEIENNESASVADLVAGLNNQMGANTYQFIDTGIIGEDAIKVGLIYKPSSVNAMGEFAILDSSVDSRFIDNLNRPVLAQTFAEVGQGGKLTVAVNHFKSKGSGCDDLGDPDLMDGQGNCNGTRTDAALALTDWLTSDPTASGDPDFLIIGDLNAYDKEDPISAITNAGYTDLVAEFNGELAYSFLFAGQVGYLDHALSTAILTQQVTNTSIWHINADEPDILNYDTSFKRDAQDALFAEDPFRSSDHDPVVIDFDLFVVPSNKDQCKKGGWQALRRHDGSRFKNQGICIRYVNTGK